ncbi:Pyruvate/Phosphoenolpyruvate kinase-like domain-containing protein [Talaromyces proteolyticus]|uniref:Pyruvate/Phosphoenolpyruvate kinase-like domain-containing protein n=1 Tax=Talaromyces proteolyticus TaxID=1131652 RepID=A0AAD4KX85_9EURO|nr:Pyruvate/Phosphoenolpyruvate kinase-like domain-containing protein [Talaromyces proteolyticus]KAH8698857.1 Pyruvate/Phosphoenolpyruvate kinase-like domain-containing protein [Talaromyces proteolyticus]
MTRDDTNGVITPATKLRRKLESGEFILAPGVYDGFSARIALEVGFDVIYMTGAGTTASRLGHADLGIATLNDMRQNAEMIANLSTNTPLIADADTGYGGPIMVARTIEQYARSGVAGLHIEDQVQTKRCGHLAGKVLVDTETYVSRIRAAVQQRKKIRSDIVIIARTDALQKHGYAESVARLRAARDAGADVGFPEGIRSITEAQQLIADLAPWPVLLNMVEHSVTPSMSASEAKDLGFQIMIVPLATMSPVYRAIKDSLQVLKKTGVPNTEFSPQQLFRVCGLDESVEIDEAAGSANFEGGVDQQ